jgi:hypothetical protein
MRCASFFRQTNLDDNGRVASPQVGSITRSATSRLPLAPLTLSRAQGLPFLPFEKFGERHGFAPRDGMESA